MKHKNDCECYICQGKLSIPDVHRIIKQNICEYGWHSMAVGPGEGSTGYVYTIGLSAKGQREFVIVGLRPVLGHESLIAMISLADTVDTLPTNERITGVADGYDVMLYEVAQSVAMDKFGPAFQHFPYPRFLQIIWPDANNRFPHEADCDPEFKSVQILTGH